MVKKTGIITINADYNYVKSVKNGAKFISVGFNGHNEGSGTPCDTTEIAEREIKYLIKLHEEKYKIVIVDKRIKQDVLFNSG